MSGIGNTRSQNIGGHSDLCIVEILVPPNGEGHHCVTVGHHQHRHNVLKQELFGLFLDECHNSKYGVVHLFSIVKV